jgi:hypothetical protein
MRTSVWCAESGVKIFVRTTRLVVWVQIFEEVLEFWKIRSQCHIAFKCRYSCYIIYIVKC